MESELPAYLLLIQQPSAGILSLELGALLSGFWLRVEAASNNTIECLTVYLSLYHATVVALTCELLHESHTIALDGYRCYNHTIQLQGATLNEGNTLVANSYVAVVSYRSCGDGSHGLSGHLLNGSGGGHCLLSLLSLCLLVSLLISTFFTLT